MRCALQLLGDLPGITILRRSSIYRTPAWGVENQPDFLNAAAKIRCDTTPQKLLNYLKSIEQQLGRVPRERWGPREIDLDILLFGATQLNQADLCIPHPGLLERTFVLVPLLEIDPSVTHPNGQLISEMARETLVTAHEVRKFQDASELG
jgi:2-amino-4-hydroxy-6-hydroxymethyldihydropteridine diphosphokinase